MLPTELKHLVEKLSYKPNWTIHEPMRMAAMPAYEIRICADVDDSDMCRGTIGVRSSCFINETELEYMTEQAVLMKIRDAILKHEIHEMDEWFRYRGAHVVDPHPSDENED